MRPLKPREADIEVTETAGNVSVSVPQQRVSHLRDTRFSRRSGNRKKATRVRSGSTPSAHKPRFGGVFLPE
jgi:hypothetical protein